MERTPAKRSSLFLLELMIAILFFCLASAVCVQIFVKAHTTSRGTQELNTALEKVSGYTELFLADALAEDTEVFYDASWQECSKDEASYEIVIRVEPDGKLGYVQPIGADPRKVTREMTEVYGVGAFLLAGCQIYKMIN